MGGVAPEQAISPDISRAKQVSIKSLIGCIGGPNPFVHYRIIIRLARTILKYKPLAIRTGGYSLKPSPTIFHPRPQTSNSQP